MVGTNIVKESGRFKLSIATMAIFCSGCVTISSGPERGFDPNVEAMSVINDHKIPDGAQLNNQGDRNNFVAARMYAVDLEYSTYFEKLLKERQVANTALDIGLLGLTMAGTITPGAQAKTAIAAASTAFAGAKTDIDQDIYMSSTLQILMNTMESQRLAVRNRIDANMKLTPTDYPTWRAMTDLDDYYRAGTLAGALQFLSASTGQNAQNQNNLQNGTTANAAPTNTTNPGNVPGATPRTSATSLGGPASVLPPAQ
jgi:hypothetical protein